MKFGLLRAICGGVSPLTLGVNWYLTGDESHNADGKHISYLQPGATHHASLRSCDPDLMSRLAEMVVIDRSVVVLEESGVLPVGSLTFSERLIDTMGDIARRAWHSKAFATLASADVIFADPDNGIRCERRGSKPAKFVFLDELADYSARGQSLVVYHHADRSAGGVAAQVPRRLAELAMGTGVAPIGAVVARRGSTRYFFILPAQAHRDRMEAAVAAHVARWTPHVEYVPYVATESQPLSSL